MADDPRSLSQRANLEVLRNSNTELEKAKKTLEDITKIQDRQLQLTKEIQASDETRTTLIQQFGENSVEVFEFETKITKIKEEQAQIDMDRRLNEEQLLELKERYGDLSVDEIKKSQESLKLEQERLEVAGDIVSEITSMTKNMGDFGTAVGKIGGAFTKAGKDRTRFMELGNKVASLGKEGSAINKFGNAFTQTFSRMSVTSLAFVGIAGMIVGKIFSMGLEIDNLSKSFQKSTGFNKDFSFTIAQTTAKVNMMGASASDVSAAFGALASNFSAFNKDLDKTNKQLAETIITLQQFGITADKSSKAMDFFNKAMGMSTEQSRKLTVQISTMGLESDITMTQMMSNFDEARNRIGLYGQNSIRVLRDLSIQAKASGLSVSSLLAISGKFDTFEGAADSVSKLNAVLGTNLSTMQMVEMNDAQRIEAIRKEVKARVGSFDSLDKHSQLYLQTALGASSLEEAARLVDMNPQQYADYNSRLAESAENQKTLAEQAEKLVPLQEQLKISFNQLLTELTPLAIAVVKFIDGLLKAKEVVVPVMAFFTTLTTVLGALIVVAKVVGFVMALMGAGALTLSAPVLATVGAVLLLVSALASLWSYFTITGSPAMYEMPKVMGENFSAMGDMAGNLAKMLLGPIGALSSLWDIFHKEGSPELYELPQAFADNFASIEESVAGTMGSITNFISVMKEFASLEYDGFVAVRTDGGSTSMVMGSDGIIKQMSEGRLSVDVNMPEIKMPPININVTFNDKRLKDLISVEIAKKIGGAL